MSLEQWLWCLRGWKSPKMLGKASGILERSRISGILVCSALGFLFFPQVCFVKFTEVALQLWLKWTMGRCNYGRIPQGMLFWKRACRLMSECKYKKKLSKWGYIRCFIFGVIYLNPMDFESESVCLGGWEMVEVDFHLDCSWPNLLCGCRAGGISTVKEGRLGVRCTTWSSTDLGWQP